MQALLPIIAAAAAAFVGAAQAQTRAPEHTFRAATIDARTSVYNQAIGIPFAERVALLTDGSVRIDVVDGGVLSPICKIFQAVQDGRADAAIGPASFLGGQRSDQPHHLSFPSGLGSDFDHRLVLLRRRRGHADPASPRDNGAALHSAGAGPAEIFAHSHKPIQKVEDLKGVKFRALGNWAAILRDEFGASPTVVPGPEIYSHAREAGDRRDRILDAGREPRPRLPGHRQVHRCCRACMRPPGPSSSR